MKQLHSIRLILPMILLLSIVGCASIRGEKPATVPIAQIQSHPRDWVGKTVQVSGEVKDAFSLVFYKYFVVKDSTGEIQVVTSKPLPKKGEKIQVEGKVEEGFAIGRETRTVLREKG